MPNSTQSAGAGTPPSGIAPSMKLFWLLLAFGAPLALYAQGPAADLLASLRDRARPLLIFAPRPDDTQLQIQLRTLKEHAAEAADRQLRPIALVYGGPSPTDLKLSQAEQDRLRQRFHVPPDRFTVILVGKDGGGKLHSSHPLSIEALSSTIDAMPMRQDEMRRQGTGR